MAPAIHPSASPAGTFLGYIRAGNFIPFIFGLATTTMFLDFEFSVGGARVRIFDVTLLLLAIVYGTSITLSGKIQRVIGKDFLLVYFLYILYTGLNGIALASTKTVIIESAQALSFALFFWLLTDLLRDEARFHAFFIGLLTGLWAISLGNAAYFLLKGNSFGFKRGTGAQKLAHSYSLVATVAYAFYNTRKRTFISYFLILLAVALTIMSGERKGWLAASAAILILPIITNSGRLMPSRLIQRVLVLSVIAIPFIFIADGTSKQSYLTKQVQSTFSAFNKTFLSSYDPLSDITDTISNRTRSYVADRAKDTIGDHPIFGIGIRQFEKYIEEVSKGLPSWLSTGIHNEYLRVTAELGFVGLFIYLCLIGAMLKRAMLAVRSMPYLDDQLRFRLRAGLTLLVYGLVMNTFRASGGITTLAIFLPAAILYFPTNVIQVKSGALRLSSFRGTNGAALS